MKNLGFTLDCHLTMNAHVSNIARTCYFELRRLASTRRFLTSTATAILVSAFVLSRIDYCNSVSKSLRLLPYTGLLGTLLTLTAHHLLLNFPVFQSFHLLKMQTSSVTFCALY